MNRTAQSITERGRYGDNALLHVSQRELQGIERITGRKFTVNPDTGLPEAFSFADLLPVAAGLVGTLVGGPGIGAAAAGATSTGKSLAEGKDLGTALTSGLVSGVTSYATAGLAEGIGNIGAKAATDAASNAAAGTAAQAGVESAAAGIPQQLGTTLPLPYAQAGAMDRLGYIGTALNTAPMEVGKQLASGPGLMALGGTAAQFMSGDAPTIRRKPYDPSAYPEQFGVPRVASMPGQDYTPGRSPEFRYFAEGGLAAAQTQNTPNYPEAMAIMQDARGSMNRVRGAGGGLDDMVPATIEDQEPVRLADGEYIVSADVVSALGDGSTDEGVRKLDEMMARVRQMKTGKAQQPGPINRNAMPV